MNWTDPFKAGEPCSVLYQGRWRKATVDTVSPGRFVTARIETGGIAYKIQCSDRRNIRIKPPAKTRKPARTRVQLDLFADCAQRACPADGGLGRG